MTTIIRPRPVPVPLGLLDIVGLALVIDVIVAGLIEVRSHLERLASADGVTFEALPLYEWLGEHSLALWGVHLGITALVTVTMLLGWHRHVLEISEKSNVYWLVAAGGAALGAFWPPLMLIGLPPVLLCMLLREAERFHVDEDRRRVSQAVVRQLLWARWTAPARALVGLLAAGVVVGALLAFGEMRLVTAPIVEGFVAPQDIRAAELYLVRNGMIYVASRAAVGALVLFLFMFVGRTLVRFDRLRIEWVPVLFTGATAIATTAVIFVATWLVFGGVVTQLGLRAHYYGVLGLFGLTLTVATLRSLGVIVADHAERLSEAEQVRPLLLAVVTGLTCLPLAPITYLWDRVGIPRPRLWATAPALAATGLIAFLAVLGRLGYPLLADYSSPSGHALLTLWVLVAVVAAVLLAHAVRFRSASGWAYGIVGAACVAGLAATVVLQPRAVDLQRIRHEYTTVGSLLAEHYPYRRQGSRLGLRSQGDLSLVFHPRGDRLHGAPSLAALADKQPPVIVVVLDALRPDRLGLHGYERRTSPNLDAFAADAVVFERAYSPATATAAGVRGLLTGSYPDRFMLQPNVPPHLPSVLVPHGYRGFAMTLWDDDFNAISLPSMLSGVDADVREGISGSDALDVTRISPDGDDAVIDQALAAIDAMPEALASRPAGQRGAFYYVHLVAAHHPWPSRPDGPDFGDSPADRYDQSVHAIDANFGRLLRHLEIRGLARSAIIVVTADHGTGLREHGRWGGFYPYEEQIRIPLLIRIPGVAPRRVTAPVSAIDVVPTVRAVFEPGLTNPHHGVSLLPLMTGEATSTGRNSLFSLCSFNDASVVIEERWKLYVHRGEDYAALFDLEQDPGERVNRIAEQPDIADRLTRRLGAFLWRGRATYGNPYHWKRSTFTLEDSVPALHEVFGPDGRRKDREGLRDLAPPASPPK